MKKEDENIGFISKKMDFYSLRKVLLLIVAYIILNRIKSQMVLVQDFPEFSGNDSASDAMHRPIHI